MPLPRFLYPRGRRVILISLILLSLNRRHDLARVLYGSELEVPDTLPRSGRLVRGGKEKMTRISRRTLEGAYQERNMGFF